MKKFILLALGVSVLLSGCGGFLATPAATSTSTPRPPTETPTPLPPTATATVTLTPTITPTFTPQPTATSTRVVQGPGWITVPVLLYHHIQSTPYFSRYRVPPERFEQQMKILSDWGYETITTDQLAQAINEGAELPPRPILITFDDGDVDVYENAFPIMEKYGFNAVFYLVAAYVNQPNYISAEQVKEMAAAGWEIGSHSLTHADLVQYPERARAEVVDSKQQLEALIGVPVTSFAYPFGKADSATIDYVQFAEYTTGMGLGYTPDQGPGNLYFLQRWEVQSSFELKSFIAYLPWKGDMSVVPTDIPLATLAPNLTTTPQSDTAP